jgi:hypothetical protein
MSALFVNRPSVCPGSSTPPTILDGHNHYEICTRLGIEFEAVEAENCPNREAAIAEIVANHLGRRNLEGGERSALGVALEKQLAAEAKKRSGARTGLASLLGLVISPQRVFSVRREA